MEDEKQARILKLERRIHNQRVALRQNWEIMEMRAGFLRHSKDVRSRMLVGWSAATREVRELRKRIAELEGTLSVHPQSQVSETFDKCSERSFDKS